MLVLTRKPGEVITIGNGLVEITLLTINDLPTGYAKFGIKAPKEFSVHRQEIQDRINNGIPMKPKEAKHG